MTGGKPRVAHDYPKRHEIIRGYGGFRRHSTPNSWHSISFIIGDLEGFLCLNDVLKHFGLPPIWSLFTTNSPCTFVPRLSPYIINEICKSWGSLVASYPSSQICKKKGSWSEGGGDGVLVRRYHLLTTELLCDLLRFAMKSYPQIPV